MLSCFGLLVFWFSQSAVKSASRTAGGKAAASTLWREVNVIFCNMTTEHRDYLLNLCSTTVAENIAADDLLRASDLAKSIKKATDAHFGSTYRKFFVPLFSSADSIVYLHTFLITANVADCARRLCRWQQLRIFRLIR